MKAGTVIRLSDGREATVVYHGLDGYGAKLGRHLLPDNFQEVSAGAMFHDAPEGYELFPDVMLEGVDFEIVESP